MMDVNIGIGAPPDADHVAELIHELEREVSKDYARPYIKRDAHPKTHGCVQAMLTVNDNLDHDLRVGVFGPDGQPAYRAWVRFSNAFQIQHDLEWEARGMGIKLLGVHLGDLLEPETASGTHDFVCATHSAFFLADRDVACYKDFAVAAATRPFHVVKFFFRHHILRGLWAMIRGGGYFGAPVLNPLSLTYHSQTPYKFGDNAVVKLRLLPTTEGMSPSVLHRVWWYLKMVIANMILMFFATGPRKSEVETWLDKYIASRNFLRMNMTTFLATRRATFDVQVQFRHEGMPTDDPTRTWSERQSPFRSVATLTIPHQVFWPAPGMPQQTLDATKEMMALGEHMSFNPWHAIGAHEPLGGINKARRRIYQALSDYRHRKNGVDDNTRANPDTRLIPTVDQYDRLADVVQLGRV